MDALWINLRYLLVAAGTALAFKACGGCVGNETIEQAAGVVIAAASGLWGNYVRKDTVAVPKSVAKAADMPQVSAGTGKVQ